MLGKRMVLLLRATMPVRCRRNFSLESKMRVLFDAKMSVLPRRSAMIASLDMRDEDRLLRDSDNGCRCHAPLILLRRHRCVELMPKCAPALRAPSRRHARRCCTLPQHARAHVLSNAVAAQFLRASSIIPSQNSGATMIKEAPR